MHLADSTARSLRRQPSGHTAPIIISPSIMQIVLTVAAVLHIVCFLLMAYRIVIGPTLADRVVAVGLLDYISIGFVIVYAIAMDQSVFLDVGVCVGLVDSLLWYVFS